jgi:phosphoribosyl 1,2-cyclic phosphate phosphodiesterase
MRLTILGSGTSMGVPVIGCACAVCTSGDRRNRRLRTSALVETHGATILIDAGPDLRFQMLRHRVTRIDAVLLTHAHTDHVGGIDDLRPFTMRDDSPLPLYGDAPTLARVRHAFDYAFDPAPSLSTRPQLETRPIAPRFSIGAIEVESFPVLHGPNAIVGYRIGPLGYVTDASALPDESIERLRGIDTLVINALRHRPHPLHLTVDQALAIVEELRPRRAVFVHVTHDLDHETTNRELPPHAQLAYDGQVIEIVTSNE